jgi:hypothetical protein
VDFKTHIAKRCPNDLHRKWHGKNPVSLYSYLSLSETRKTLILLSLIFVFNKIRHQEGRTGSARKWVCREHEVGR